MAHVIVFELTNPDHSGGAILASPDLPPLTDTFVMRKEPWEFIEKILLGTQDGDSARILVVTGMGGCGKTQLVTKFMHVHQSR